MSKAKSTSCFDQEYLQSFLAENLSESDEAEVQLHIDSCSQCQKTLEQAAADQSMWDGLRNHLTFTHLPEESLTDDSRLQRLIEYLAPTDDPEIPWCISAPTMRAPVNVSKTLNAYLAFRASLRVVQRHNESQPEKIQSILCPGLATGTGEMPADICAKQMRAAWDQTLGNKPWTGTSINEIINEHYRLLRLED